MKSFLFIPIYLYPFVLTAQTQSLPDQLEEVVVTGKAQSLIGEATTASAGQASAQDLEERPYLRRGELLEAVPGIVITQHSGDGKANQYFVRGFNLDHGTDFSVSVDGQPINFVTHAHGQGYADLNPIIPELVEELDYWKGPYFAQLGDLSTAGAAKFEFFDILPYGTASLSVGEHNYFRALLTDSIKISPQWGSIKDASKDTSSSYLTYGFEANYYDGPWKLPENSQRFNGFLKYYYQSGQDTFRVTAMGYDGKWDSTDQVPKRLIDSGGIGRFGYIDGSDGGDSNRYSLMASWDRNLPDGRLHSDAYFGTYHLDLFSNFTYYLNDPINGDQFEQEDDRRFFGSEIRREWDYGNGSIFTLGFQTRSDVIDGIGLYHTKNTERLSTVRVDDVLESNAGIYASADHYVNSWFRFQPGLRADVFHFDVDSDNSANSGNDNAAIVSPKLNLIFGPWDKTEYYLSGGMGFHSNDARGVTITTDPETGAAADKVDPLVRTYGFELGTRTEVIDEVVSTVALFYLHSDSELIYVGDAGTSEPGPATERYGVEWSTYWRPNRWLKLDHEITLSEGHFIDAGGNDEIPGAVPVTLDTGITLGAEEGFYGALRSRYFSPRPLVEDGSIDSRPSWQVNARIGYRKKNWDIALDCLNLLDRKDNDIEYYYTSRLDGESSGGVDDVHIHPAEPRTMRLTVTRHF